MGGFHRPAPPLLPTKFHPPPHPPAEETHPSLLQDGLCLGFLCRHRRPLVPPAAPKAELERQKEASEGIPWLEKTPFRSQSPSPPRPLCRLPRWSLQRGPSTCRAVCPVGCGALVYRGTTLCGCLRPPGRPLLLELSLAPRTEEGL